MSTPTQNRFPRHSTVTPPNTAHAQTGSAKASLPTHASAHSARDRLAATRPRAKSGVCASTSTLRPLCRMAYSVRSTAIQASTLSVQRRRKAGRVAQKSGVVSLLIPIAARLTPAPVAAAADTPDAPAAAAPLPNMSPAPAPPTPPPSPSPNASASAPTARASASRAQGSVVKAKAP